MTDTRREEINQMFKKYVYQVVSSNAIPEDFESYDLDQTMDFMVYVIPNEDYTFEFFVKMGLTIDDLIQLNIATELNVNTGVQDEKMA